MNRLRIFGAVLGGLLLTSASGLAQQWARVVRVVDGDTYELRAGGQTLRVRVLGVDAPELSQPGGRQAADSVRALLRGRVLRLQRAGTDAYGRVLGRLRLAPPLPLWGATLALDSLLVVRGWAWAYSPGQAVAALANEQLQAQAARRGIWKCGTSDVIRPTVWRDFNKQEKARAWVGCPWY